MSTCRESDRALRARWQRLGSAPRDPRCRYRPLPRDQPAARRAAGDRIVPPGPFSAPARLGKHPLRAPGDPAGAPRGSAGRRRTRGDPRRPAARLRTSERHPNVGRRGRDRHHGDVPSPRHRRGRSAADAAPRHRGSGAHHRAGSGARRDRVRSRGLHPEHLRARVVRRWSSWSLQGDIDLARLVTIAAAIRRQVP